MKHTNFEQRLEFISSTLRRRFDLESRKIEPVAYHADCPFPYNNFVYRVEVAHDIERKTIASEGQPGTVPLPKNVSQLIFRLSNDDATGLHNKNRVENEVATMSLVRDALSHSGLSPRLVPTVYAWASASGGQEWILQEYMPGVTLDEALKEMAVPSQRRILGQMADVLSSLQLYQLPDSVRQYGGVTFDGLGTIVSGPSALLNAGPFKDFSELCQGMLRAKLAASDKNPVLAGWRPNSVRDRLDQFIAHGLHVVLRDLDLSRMVILHGDFTINNLLFDQQTLQMTALLDFYFSRVGCIAEEFLQSFGDIGGRLRGPLSRDEFETAMRDALLQGFANPSPPPSASNNSRWDIAKAWDEELAKRNIQRPSTINGIEALSRLYWLSDQICPFLLSSQVMLMSQWNEERVKKERTEVEERLVNFLEERGF
ncbi:MAG: hypothetical protein M1826_002576 [Phylliscum demangeonii]|nr:MAG: hypothetical protein M1826_002576 [Phylliscum demangeonii]